MAAPDPGGAQGVLGLNLGVLTNMHFIGPHKHYIAMGRVHGHVRHYAQNSRAQEAERLYLSSARGAAAESSHSMNQ